MIVSETRVYSPAQAAGVLGVSTERVRQLGHAGRLPYAVTPLGRLFDADAIDAMARERAQRASHLGAAVMPQTHETPPPELASPSDGADPTPTH